MTTKLCNNYKVMESKADKQGYTIIKHFENGCFYASKFKKGNRRVWSIREGWQTADLIDGRFTNHLKFNNIDDAFSRQVTK